MDWSPILQAVIGLVAAMIGLCTAFVSVILLPRLIANYEKDTGVKVTDQEKAAVYAAAQTEANILKAAVEKGRITAAVATDPNSPVVENSARTALTRVATSAAAQNTTVAGMQQIIAGRAATIIEVKDGKNDPQP